MTLFLDNWNMFKRLRQLFSLFLFNLTFFLKDDNMGKIVACMFALILMNVTYLKSWE